MGKPKRTLHALSTLTTSPPSTLPPTYTIAQLVKATGNNLYLVHLPTQLPPHPPVLVEMAPQFRSQIWLRRGGYVLVDTAAFGEGEGKEGGKEMKIKGVIVNIVREEKGWRKMSYWPKEFPPQDPWGGGEDSEGEEEDEGEDGGWDKIRYSDDDEGGEEEEGEENNK